MGRMVPMPTKICTIHRKIHNRGQRKTQLYCTEAEGQDGVNIEWWCAASGTCYLGLLILPPVRTSSFICMHAWSTTGPTHHRLCDIVGVEGERGDGKKIKKCCIVCQTLPSPQPKTRSLQFPLVNRPRRKRRSKVIIIKLLYYARGGGFQTNMYVHALIMQGRERYLFSSSSSPRT